MAAGGITATSFNIGSAGLVTVQFTTRANGSAPGNSWQSHDMLPGLEGACSPDHALLDQGGVVQDTAESLPWQRDVPEPHHRWLHAVRRRCFYSSPCLHVGRNFELFQGGQN